MARRAAADRRADPAHGLISRSRCPPDRPMPWVMARPTPRRVPPHAPAPASLPRRGADRWPATVADLAALKDSHPMLDAVIDEIDGRMIRIGDHWLGAFPPLNTPRF